ncbi:nuclear transport factor 2 family protein [Demequina sp. NBRC 110052]|uniref:nuclear transport factor 2 family protein n=1 Tax=Demequina sp. NBRC 110052 TaxID=1570341 RepID=UPI000A04B79D|nr:nuclear transport factor 2 family protein [Demequina sp. NBRC 110052]
MRTAEAEQLVALERDGWEALTHGRAREFYDDVLAQDAVMVFPFGVMERDDAIDGMAESRRWQDYELRDVTVHDLGAGIVVVTYHAHAERDEEGPFDAMLSSTYVRSRAGWRMMLHQQSP